MRSPARSPPTSATRCSIPPSTPVIFIGTTGQITLTDFGHKSPDEIVALAEEHGA